MKTHVAELLANGLCYRNPRSRWCSPPVIVRKSNGDLRMTVDVRVPNLRVDQVVWAMPILKVALDHLRGLSRYFALDFSIVFWQAPNREAPE